MACRVSSTKSGANASVSQRTAGRPAARHSATTRRRSPGGSCARARARHERSRPRSYGLHPLRARPLACAKYNGPMRGRRHRSRPWPDDLRWFASNAYHRAPRAGAPAARARRSRPRATGPRAWRSPCRGSSPRRPGDSRGPAGRDYWCMSGICRPQRHGRRPARSRLVAGRPASPAPEAMGRLRPAAGLLQPAALHRRAGGRRLGAERVHGRDRGRAVRRGVASGCRTATTRTDSSPGQAVQGRAAGTAHRVPAAGRTRIRRSCCTPPPRSGARSRCGSSAAGPTRRALEVLARRLGVRCRVETTADDAAVTRAYREARWRSARAGSRASGSRRSRPWRPASPSSRPTSRRTASSWGARRGCSRPTTRPRWRRPSLPPSTGRLPIRHSSASSPFRPRHGDSSTCASARSWR